MGSFYNWLQERRASAIAQDSDFKEEDHPRNDKGGTGGGRFRTSGKTLEREDGGRNPNQNSAPSFLPKNFVLLERKKWDEDARYGREVSEQEMEEAWNDIKAADKNNPLGSKIAESEKDDFMSMFREYPEKMRAWLAQYVPYDTEGRMFDEIAQSDRDSLKKLLSSLGGKFDDANIIIQYDKFGGTRGGVYIHDNGRKPIKEDVEKVAGQVAEHFGDRLLWIGFTDDGVNFGINGPSFVGLTKGMKNI